MSKICVGVLLVALGATALNAAQPREKGGGCHESAVTTLPFSDAKTPDEFMVESIGGTCPGARLVIYVKTQNNGWHPLMIAKTEDFAGGTPNRAAMKAVVKEVASRIERPARAQLESWESLQKAGEQPEGAPWRGTMLPEVEYKRLYAQKPRAIIVPTDAARGKLIVWDDTGSGRPVDFVFYGD